METNVNNTQIALPDTFKPEVFKKLIDNAPAVYQSSKSRIQKAIEVGNRLISLAAQSVKEIGKITPELDNRLNNYLVNSRNALKEINEERSPITQMFTAVSKLYTGLENEIDASKADTIPAKIQKLRNDYAAWKAKEEEKRQQKLAKQKNIELEKVSIRAEIEKQIELSFINYLTEIKNKLMAVFNQMTLENFTINLGVIKAFSDIYPKDHYLNMQPSVTWIYLTPDDVTLIVKESVENTSYEKFAERYKAEILTCKNDLIEKAPGKQKELEAFAQADEANKARIEKDRIEREKAEKERIENEAETAKLKAQTTAETNKQAMSANTLFDMEAKAVPVDAMQIKKKYVIEITHPSGYLPIISFYFQKEGLKESIEKLQKKTLASMVTFAEKVYNETGEQVNNPHVVYKESIKAINK